jgi:hypothetical protein
MVIKSRRMRRVRLVARMVDTIDEYKILIVKPEGKRPY